MLICPLCSESKAAAYFLDQKTRGTYFLCGICDLCFLDPQARPSPEAEKSQYLLHENDTSDFRYQAFVEPLYRAIRSRTCPSDSVLDYGCGPGPVVSTLLQEDGYTVSFYDPFFATNQEALERKYKLVFACEVAEHFFWPGKEFESLTKMLDPGGTLAIMTLLRTPEIDFGSWHYRRDPTHVAFFSLRSFDWIKKRFGFSRVESDGKRVILLQL